ncbi:MAG TPA: hypothetical protein VJ373_09070 [Desulfatiglandales bacterium]|nr:hypothetical protein [Desulfatiglandales bacterium]
MHIVKKILIVAVIAALFYFLLGYHYVYLGGKSVKMLKKTEYTLKYTFFSTMKKSTQSMLSIPELWNAGIGELLLNEGVITENEYEKYRLKMEGEEY